MEKMERKKTVSYYALGCKVNLYETEALVQELCHASFRLVPFNEKCDVSIINTCTVTSTADAKSRKIIRQAIRRSPDAIIVVMGCYAQLNKEDVLNIKGIDIIAGTANRREIIPEILKKLKSGDKKLIDLTCDVMQARTYEDLKINKYPDKTRAFVKIEDGCDNYCSYCRIPYARGHVRSRRKEDIIDEVQRLSDDDVKEIVLTGINTGAYGHDLKTCSLAMLLDEICQKVSNLGRIRLSSIEMTEITPHLLTVIKKNSEHFAMHLHVPLQGGCDSLLKRMNRRYNIEQYQEKIKLIRSYFPLINITTDVIVAFNGETEDEFCLSRENIKKIGFGEMHVFPYSRRPKTKAYQDLDVINPDIKRKRVASFLQLNKEASLAYRKSFLNKFVSVLIEKCENNVSYGYSSEYMAVKITRKLNENSIVVVKITNIGYPYMIGE